MPRNIQFGPVNTNIDWTSIREVQDEITAWASSRFPHRTDHHAIYKLMVEEIPELAMHKKERGTEEIGPELADCFILLMDLASLWEVDVVQAIREKMEINYNRTWAQDANGIMQHVPVQDDPQSQVIYPAVTVPEVPKPFVIGERCPQCLSQQVVEAPVTSPFMYQCVVCSHQYGDDIPF